MDNTQKEQLQLMKGRVEEMYEIKDLRHLFESVTSFYDLFWFLQMTGLVPGLNLKSFVVILNINGIKVDDQPSSSMVEALNEVVDEAPVSDLRPSQILTHIVETIKSLYSLSDAKTYLAERITSFEDLRQFLALIEDISIYDGCDVLDLMISLIDTDWLITDDVSASYAAAWTKVRAQEDFNG